MMRVPHVTGAWFDVERQHGPRVVLVVEAERADGRALPPLLDAFGYRVHHALDVAHARALVAASTPDAVLLDWELPDGGAVTLMAEWMEHLELRWVPVLVMTSSSDPQLVRSVLGCGATDFVRRTADVIELEARLLSALRLGDVQAQMRALAQRDGLTGLWNRRVALERVERTVRGKDSNPAKRVSAAMIDIDYFKRINDRHGHDVGDVVLQQFAEQIARDLGPYGCAARFGGEEFLVVLPGHTAAVAHRRLLSLREHVAERRFGGDELALLITFSAGIACADVARSTSHLELLKRADVALYEAKAQGRDRIALADQPSN
jgi:two-component system cell cycle response regulator